MSPRDINAAGKRRILIIETGTDLTGGIQSALRSGETLRPLNDFIFLLPTGSRAITLIREKGFGVCELPMKELRRNLIDVILYIPMLIVNARALARLLKKQHIDLIISNDFYSLLAPAYRFFGGKVRYMCYVRFLPSRFPGWLAKTWQALHRRHAVQIIAVSNAVKKELRANAKIVVIPGELPLKESAYATANSQVILFPANYIRGKGQEYAIACLKTLHSKHPQWKVRFVGSDMGLAKNSKFKVDLMDTARHEGLNDCVDFDTFTPDMERAYLNAAIVLNFSESESFSLTCLEAMFYGRAVLATRCGGPEELIEDHVTGLLTPVGDVTAMTKSLDILITDAALRERLGRSAYTSVRERFSVRNTSSVLGDLIEKALSGDRGTAGEKTLAIAAF